MRLRRTLVLVAAIIACSCVIIAGGYFLVLPIVFPPPDITSRLAVIDAALSGGYLSTARAELLAIRPFPRGERDALRIFKRAYALCREGGDFGLLAVMCDRAQISLSSSPAIRLVAAYSWLRTGRLSDAEAVAGKGLPAGNGELVRGEILLRKGGSWLGSDSLTRDLVKLETSRQALDFVQAAQSVDDKRLGLDAALLSLSNGDLASAREIAATALQDSAFDEPASLIAYDAGDFQTAVARLTRLQSRRGPRADIALLQADCYHAMGRSSDYGDALHAAIRLDPRISWTPYADLALLAETQGTPSLARDILAQGRAVFPGSRELVLATARLEAGQGNPAAALSLLDALVAERPDDAEAALLRLALAAPGLSAQAYRAALWKLFDRLPSDQKVYMTLISALVTSHDWESAGIAIHQHEIAQGGQDADGLAIHGLVEAVQGKEDRAAGLLSQAANQDGGGKYRYDLAVLLLRAGHPREALAQLGNAETEAGSSAGVSLAASASAGRQVQARIRTLKGRCLLATGDIPGARDAFLRARVLDPHLLEPGLELRKLEAQRDQ